MLYEVITNPGASLAAQPFDGFGQVAGLDGLTVDGDDLVAAPDARPRRGRTGNRGYHRHGAVDVVDFDADARVAARRADADVAILARVQKFA